MTPREAAARFALHGEIRGCERYGNGHINETYRVETTSGAYILQKINQGIFHDVDALMRNIRLVCAHLAGKDPDPRHSMKLIETPDGEVCFRDEAGEAWRMYDFIGDSLCLQSPETPEEFAACARAFGGFQNQLADFPAQQLTETIPKFHDTRERYRQLHQAIREDRAGRAKSVAREIEQALEWEPEAGALLDAGLPLRVTHNDTKINNVLLDARTREPLCVIDLDTVMPGFAACDFGDSIRFGASTAPEDERNLDRVWMSLELYEIYTQSYVETCRQMTPDERRSLPWGAKLMTLECGIRFLADHLNGDTYFHISREGHNLDRARTQLKLVKDMEKKWDDMRRIAER